jgi:hypothetical protein
LNKDLNNINNEGFKIFGFVEVLIEVNSKYTISPLISVHDGKLTDLKGTMKVIRFTEELNFILKNGGCIKHVYSGVIFNVGKPLNTFATKLYDDRTTTDKEGLKAIYKLLLNSGYGRFALKDNIEQTYISNNEDYNLISEYRSTSQEYRLNSEFLLHNVEVMPDYDKVSLEDSGLNKTSLNKKINPKVIVAERGIHIAACITAYARINLLSKIYDIIDNNGTVYYLDTDSIYYEQGNKEINSSKKLGE